VRQPYDISQLSNINQLEYCEYINSGHNVNNVLYNILLSVKNKDKIINWLITKEIIKYEKGIMYDSVRKTTSSPLGEIETTKLEIELDLWDWLK